MTHDKLLAKIDEEGEFLVQYFDSKPIVHSALRAVVKLHKPHLFGVGEIVCSACEEWTNEGPYQLSYPCPTILAITEELM
jgi:hypothetical protein